jgi:hypothetical protein
MVFPVSDKAVSPIPTRILDILRPSMKLLRSIPVFTLLLFIAAALPGCAKSGCPVNQDLYNEYRGVTKKEAKKENRKYNSLGMKAPSKVAAKQRKKNNPRTKSQKYNQKQNTKKRR